MVAQIMDETDRARRILAGETCDTCKYQGIFLTETRCSKEWNVSNDNTCDHWQKQEIKRPHIMLGTALSYNGRMKK
jgi:hypothetical protein